MALILVTGSASGLGRLTAQALIEQGHQVVVHARSRARLAESALPGAYVTVVGDLAQEDQVRAVAEQVNGHGRFDAVVHNAGVMGPSGVYAVNVVAPYLLTALMAPPRRAIVLSSSMHRTGGTELGVLSSRGAGELSRAYDTSKLMVTAFAMAMAERLSETLWHAVDPGWVPTRMGGPGASDDLEAGHRTQEWLATADDDQIDPRSGGYWHHRRTQRPHPAALDEQYQAGLLAQLAELTGTELP